MCGIEKTQENNVVIPQDTYSIQTPQKVEAVALSNLRAPDCITAKSFPDSVPFYQNFKNTVSSSISYLSQDEITHLLRNSERILQKHGKENCTADYAAYYEKWTKQEKKGVQINIKIHDAWGKRRRMEDTHFYERVENPWLKGWIVGVFDGHSGDVVAKMAASSFVEIFTSLYGENTSSLTLALKKTFEIIDQRYRLARIAVQTIERNVKLGLKPWTDENYKTQLEFMSFLIPKGMQQQWKVFQATLPKEETVYSLTLIRFLKCVEGRLKAGAVGTVALFDEVNGICVVANLGDPQAKNFHLQTPDMILPVPLSFVHDFSVEKEAQRVFDLLNKPTNAFPLWQSMPDLVENEKQIFVSRKHVKAKRFPPSHGVNISRSMGDYHVDPHHDVIRQNPTSGLFPFFVGDFIVLGTDGLWDFLSDDEIVEILQNKGRNPYTLVEKALEHGDDNITVMCIECV